MPKPPIKSLRALVLFISVTIGAVSCSNQNESTTADVTPESITTNPTAFVAIADNALKGGMKIVAVDGIPVRQMNGVDLPAGDHQISVACKLDNGISTTFAFDVSLEPNHSYCFFSQNPGKACRIVYTKIGWEGSGVVSCR